MSLSLPLAPKPSSILVKCDQCKQQNSLESSLVEKPLPAPHEAVTQYLLVCPDCGMEKHCYFSSEEGRWRQVQLASSIASLSTALAADREKIKKLTEEYSHQFDIEQEKYKEFLEKAAAQDGTGT